MWYDQLNVETTDDIRWRISKIEDSIRETNKEKTKTFDSDLGEAGEVLDKKPEEDIEAIENESEVIKFSTAVVAEAIKLGVSDVHIEPYRFSSRVRYRLDGMLTEQEQYKKFLHDNYGAVVTRFKIMGKLDIAERRLPQDLSLIHISEPTRPY